MSEEKKKETPEQELTEDQLENVAGGTGQFHVIEVKHAKIKAPKPKSISLNFEN